MNYIFVKKTKKIIKPSLNYIALNRPIAYSFYKKNTIRIIKYPFISEQKTQN